MSWEPELRDEAAGPVTATVKLVMAAEMAGSRAGERLPCGRRSPPGSGPGRHRRRRARRCAVAEVIAGTDAVLSALAPRGKKNPGLLAGAAANMVAAMEETGPRRMICVSAGGPWVRDDPNMNLLIKLVLPRVLATTFADIRGMEDTIRASGLDWTLVRASQLTDGPLTGHYRSPRTSPRAAGARSPAPTWPTSSRPR